MTDAYPGEDARIRALLENCPHEHGVIVCLECGLPMPAPDGGYDLWEGEIVP